MLLEKGLHACMRQLCIHFPPYTVFIIIQGANYHSLTRGDCRIKTLSSDEASAEQTTHHETKKLSDSKDANAGERIVWVLCM